MENIESKWDKLKKYLYAMQRYEAEMLDLLRSWEMTLEEYKKVIKDRDIAYKQFLVDLKK